MTPDRIEVVNAVVEGKLDTNHTTLDELNEFMALVMDVVNTRMGGMEQETVTLH